MARCVIIERDDGGVSVMVLIGDADPAVEVDKLRFRDEAGNIVSQERSWRLGDTSEIPTDRTFRNAWKIESDAVSVDMEKARDIQLGKIRAVRDANLSALDVPFLQAVETWLATDDKTAAQAVMAQKQVLRDLPQTVDLAKAATPDELKAIWPEELAPAQGKVS